MIKKFKAIVTREDEYIIEIDDSVINEEWIKDYCDNFTNLTTLQDHAESLAWNRMVHGVDFYEGYGNVRQDGQLVMGVSGHKEKAINIRTISSNDDIDVNVYEI